MLKIVDESGKTVFELQDDESEPEAKEPVKKPKKADELEEVTDASVE